MESTTLELVIVRHGLTDWNREQRYQGQRDIPLLLPDALDAMNQLRGQLADERFEAVYCSDLTRCRQTLAHVWDAGEASCEPRFDTRLRELDFGDYEGMRYADLKDEPLYRAWIDSRGEQAPPGGESTEQLRQRLGAWLVELFLAAEAEGHRRILTVTHGGVIRELRRRFEAIDFWDGSVSQAQGRRLTFIHRQGGWSCSSSSAVPAPASVRW